MFFQGLEAVSRLRFMDAGHTNGNPISAWADRPLPSDRTAQGSARGVALGGMAYEHMVLLANTIGADPWFCVPHAASDDYVTKVKNTLRTLPSPPL